uniref:Uncharacterized protein n=1 Tax=Glossina brevipalpis TaxID=37001 RepID=A0A1A9WPF6_9MUSC
MKGLIKKGTFYAFAWQNRTKKTGGGCIYFAIAFYKTIFFFAQGFTRQYADKGPSESSSLNSLSPVDDLVHRLLGFGYSGAAVVINDDRRRFNFTVSSSSIKSCKPADNCCFRCICFSSSGERLLRNS